MTGKKLIQQPDNSPSSVVLVECPRDAFQGLPHFIPTSAKIAYLKSLLDAGFTHIDFGSFVSPQAVPQMRDTEEVWSAIRDYRPGAYFIAIIANERGLDRAFATSDRSYRRQTVDIPSQHPVSTLALGYPFSLSEKFQQSNTGRSIADSRSLLETLHRRATESGLDLNVYLSMGFGNPYNEPWSINLVTDTLAWLRDIGIRIIVLADTTGSADPTRIRETITAARAHCPGLDLGAHLHASPAKWRAHASAALDAGCTRLDSALGGIGGCPFAQEELVGNLPTEGLLDLFRERGINFPIDPTKLPALLEAAKRIYSG